MPRFISRGSQQVRELLLQTDVQSLEAAVQQLGEATEAFAALRSRCANGCCRQMCGLQLEAAVQQLGEATEAFAALRMDRAVQLALTGRKLDEVDNSQSGSPGGEADAAVH